MLRPAVSTLSAPLSAASGSLGSRRSLSSLKQAKQAWNGRLILSEEVEHALEKDEPVIALESTIITHGMPHPANLNTALSLESILRSSAVTPATIALLEGKVHVGVTQAQLERLADTSSTEKKVKVSRRDIAPALASKVVGGTTVAGTMYVGETVGIPLFVTGGIGGAHRGSENSMDVSADLIELGRTPMGVVCAGAKSILDIPRTLEVLETQGVCVATYGETPDFPAFYTPKSGQKSPWSVNTPLSAAEMIHAGLTLPNRLSTLLAVPIPAEHEAVGNVVQEAVELAVKESIEQGIDKRGKEVTPWLLKRVGELTSGRALNLNIKLIENNAQIGAAVAVEMARLRQEARKHASSSSFYPPARLASAKPETITALAGSAPAVQHSAPNATAATLPPPRVIVFGSAAMDLTSHSAHPLSPRSTTPGSIYLTPGGVGRNIAEAAQNLLPSNAVMLVSPLGTDAPDVPDAVGKMLLLEMKEAGMRTDGLVLLTGERSAACSLVLEGDKDLVNGVADMGIVEQLSADVVDEVIGKHQPKLIVFDCNPREEVVRSILTTAQKERISTFCDTTSIPKLPRLANSIISLLPQDDSAPRPLTHLTPNTLELDLLHASLTSDSLPDEIQSRAWNYISSLNLTSDFRVKLDAYTNDKARAWLRDDGVVQKAIACLPFVSSFWIKSGSRGLVHIGLSESPLASAASSSHPSTGSTRAQGVSHKTGDRYLNIAHYPAKRIPADEVVSTTGAGDTLAGGLVAGLIASSSADQERAWANAGEREAAGTHDGESGKTLSQVRQRGTEANALRQVPSQTEWVEVAMERAQRSIRSRRAVG